MANHAGRTRWLDIHKLQTILSRPSASCAPPQTTTSNSSRTLGPHTPYLPNLRQPSPTTSLSDL
ncbi:MAG: hypothetical protein ACK56F_29665, partial [bacterium]